MSHRHPRRGHSLVAKRLPDERYESMARRAREALDGTPPSPRA
ncbi:hypothetical protein [Halosegnis marinus]